MSASLPFEGVAAVAVVVSPSLRGSMVTEKHHTGMISIHCQPHDTHLSYPLNETYPSGVLANRSKSELWSRRKF